jgi:aspartate racemase
LGVSGADVLNSRVKCIGLIGGITPEATVEYYRQLIASYRTQKSDGSYPSILINSINLTKLLSFVLAGEFETLTDYLVSEVAKLARAGADFALLTSSTSHIVFQQVRNRAPVPLISLVEAACEQAQALGLTRVGLIGTRYTMQGQFFTDVFSKVDIAIVVPRADEQVYIHDKYMSELANAVFLPETRAGFMGIAQRLIDRDAIQGLILGGTELPLILRDYKPGIPVLDTVRIHVEKAISRVLSAG